MFNHSLGGRSDSRPFSLSQATQPVNFIVTNHPKRSWFAEIYYDPSRKDETRKGSIDGMFADPHIIPIKTATKHLK